MNTQYGYSTSYCKIQQRAKSSARAVGHRKERVRVRQMQHIGTLTILAVILMSLAIILGSTFLSSYRSNAASNENTLYKYYTSIQVQAGDTLWSIAQQYAPSSEISQQDYVDEIISMNHLQGDTIHAGDYLTISYYSSDFK